MYWILPCTYMQEHTGSARACSHTTVYARRRVCTRAHICTHRGTSVQRTPSILNPDPGLLSVFTCKWSTTICGPSRLLRPSSRLGPGMRAASQMGVCGGGTTSDGLPWSWSQALGKRGKRGREEAACLAATETAGTPTYHGSGPWFGPGLESSGERCKGPSERPFSCARAATDAGAGSPQLARGLQSRKVGQKMAGNLVSSLWVEGVIFDKCICGCGGVGVNDKKL